VVTVARPPRPGSPTPPPEHGRRRTRPDGRLDTGRLDTGRVDSRRPTAGPSGGRPQVTGHRTAGLPDPGRPKPDGWTSPAGQRRPTPWLGCWQVDHGDDARPLETGWTLLRANIVWASNNQDRSTARTPRHHAATGGAWPPPRPSAAGGTPPSSWRLGALLSSDDFGSSVERRGGCHPVHAGREDAYGVRCSVCWVERVAGCSGRCVKLGEVI
jgi:hypothetical protein